MKPSEDHKTTPVRLRKATHSRLLDIAHSKDVTMDFVISYLLDAYEEKKLKEKVAASSL